MTVFMTDVSFTLAPLRTTLKLTTMVSVTGSSRSSLAGFMPLLYAITFFRTFFSFLIYTSASLNAVRATGGATAGTGGFFVHMCFCGFWIAGCSGIPRGGPLRYTGVTGVFVREAL